MRDKYKVKEVVDSNTGKVERFYTYDGKPCHRVQMSTKLCKQLAGYALIEKDLRSVAVWLSEIELLRKGENGPPGYVLSPDRKTYNLVKGFFVAALTFYGKCFSKCEGRPVKLERTQLDEKYRENHDELVRLRHNFAAHSGDERIEHVEIALVLPPKNKLAVSPMIYRELYQPDFMVTRQGEIKLIDVVEHARSIAIRKINLLNEKIFVEEINTKKIDYWRSK